MAVDEKLQTVRHSCAHVMAQAIKRIFPGTKIAIGPAIDNGFYYDFDFPEGKKITESDFAAVEKEMRKILAGNFDFVRKEVSKEEALKIFRALTPTQQQDILDKLTDLSPRETA